MARDIGEWLDGLGLGRYAEAFADNEIDFDALPHITEEDLKQIGVALGARRSLLAAIARLDGTDRPEASGKAPDRAAGGAEAERRQLTIMFVDLVGSTALSQRLDPEDLREVMREYQDAVAGAVARYGGHVAKYLGDGVLAFFGWPRAHEDQAERAVRAGLAAVAAAGAIAREGESLRARAGIATGQVVVGDLVGAASRETEAVSGETPNLAARLQEAAGPGAVVVSDATRRLIGATFELEDLGARSLKGFAEPLPVWRVVGEAAAESRFDAAHGALLTRFVGREHELGLLLDRWTRAKGGEGQVVALSGEAGIGKSRLVQALGEAIAGEPHTRVRYQCSPYHVNSALYPVVRQLERAAGFAPEDDDRVKLDKLEAALAGPGSKDPDTLALFATLLSLDADERVAGSAFSPQQVRAKTLDALSAELRALAERQPVLFILEDAHWIDPTTQGFVDQTVGQVEALPVLMVVTHRPDYQPPFAGHGQVSALALNRLGRDQVAEMVRAVAGDTAERIVGQVTARSGGVPLFVEELTRSIVEAGIARGDGAVEIPETLQASLLARLDRLGAGKELAQVGAVIGREFSYDLLSAVVEMPGPDLDAGLDRMVDSQMLYRRGTPPDATFVFKHALIQDAAYDSLLRERRQALHRRVAEILEERFPETGRAEPELLAHHFSEALSADKAIEYWRRAGELASSRSANTEALAHLKRGLALIEDLPEASARETAELELLLLLGPVLLMTQGFASPEAGQAYERADALCQRLGATEPSFAAAWGLWIHKQQSAQFENAIEIADRLLDIARHDGNEEHLLQAHHSAWTSRFASEELESVIEHTEAGLKLYDKERHHTHAVTFGGHDPGVCCRIISGMARLIGGWPALGRALTVDSVALGRDLDHPFSLALALSFSGTSHFLLGEIEQVALRMEELSRVVNIHGFAPIRPNMDILRGWARVAGDGDRSGIDLIQDGLAELERSGLKRLSFQQYVLANAFHRLGAAAPAMDAIDRAVQTVAEFNEHRWESEIYRLKGMLLEAAGETDTGGAESFHRRAVATARDQSARYFELRAASGLARYLGERGAEDEARRILAPIYEWFTEGFETPDLVDAKALLAQLG